MNIETIGHIDLSEIDYRVHRHLMSADIFLGALERPEGALSPIRRFHYKAYREPETAKTVIQTYLKLLFWAVDAKFYRVKGKEVDFYADFTDYNWLQSWKDLKNERN